MGSFNDNFIMQSRLLTFFLVFAEILVSQTVPVPEDEYDSYIDPWAVNDQFQDPRTCILPEPLEYGLGKSFEDCNDRSLMKLKTPPNAVWALKGSYPMICCPNNAVNPPKCDPNIPKCDYNDYDEESESFDYKCCGFINDEIRELDEFWYGTCQNGTVCTSAAQCGIKDFNQDKPPTTCAFDEITGEDKFCCQDLGPDRQRVTEPQASQFPSYPCIDHTSHCSRWVKNEPKSCSPEHKSYPFMRESCQKTCGRCGDKGCVDHYAKCQSWSNLGYCHLNANFMFFNCRESCGSCGFKSPFNHENQVWNGKQFTDLNSKEDFMCGRYKKKNENEIEPIVQLPNSQREDSGSCSMDRISDRYVLTAAHCLGEYTVFDPKTQTRTVNIRTGTKYAEAIGVKREWVHPWREPLLEKEFKSMYFDIAVMELERRIIYDFDKYGDSPSCLEERDNIDNIVAITQGFGIAETGKIPNKNLETNVTIISNQECYDLLSKVPFPTHKTTIKSTLFDGVTDQVVCTKGFLENGVVTGPCNGDSGGPLYINGQTADNGDIVGRTIAGVVSGGIGCGGKSFENYPKWFARVSSFAKWIKCTKQNADKNLSYKNVERNCDEGELENPFPPRCDHTELFFDAPKGC